MVQNYIYGWNSAWCKTIFMVGAPYGVKTIFMIGTQHAVKTIFMVGTQHGVKLY